MKRSNGVQKGYYHGSACGLRSASVAAVSVVATLLVLRATWPHWPALIELLRHPSSDLNRRGPDAACAQIAGLALWLVTLVVSLGLTAALLGQLPGVAGAINRRVATVLLPRIVLRVVVGVTGASVALTPIAAEATTGGTAPASAVASAQASTMQAPAWPTDSATTTETSIPTLAAPTQPITPLVSPTPTALPTPVVAAPTTSVTTRSAATAAPLPQRVTDPTATPAASSSPSPKPISAPTPAQDTQTTVTVTPGDSLWVIAARRLGRDASAEQITASWPQWYAANRQHLGSDPNLIHPGEQLIVPKSP